MTCARWVRREEDGCGRVRVPCAWGEDEGIERGRETIDGAMITWDGNGEGVMVVVGGVRTQE